MRLLTASTAILLLVFALALTACGGDDDDDATGGDTTATPSQAAGDDGGDDGGNAVTFVEIDAADFSFSPDAVDVAADTELTFVLANTGSAPHTLDVYTDEGYSEPVEGASTGNVPGGTVRDFKATLAAGDYFFRCELHPGQMQGTITAQ